MKIKIQILLLLLHYYYYYCYYQNKKCNATGIIFGGDSIVRYKQLFFISFSTTNKKKEMYFLGPEPVWLLIHIYGSPKCAV